MDTTENSDEKPPKIKRGRVDSLSLYEITENELEILEKGSPTSIYLNFSIFLLSVAVSCLLALFTSTFKSEIALVLFIVITVIGFLFGALLMLLWQRTKSSVADVIKRIKERIPSD